MTSPTVQFTRCPECDSPAQIVLRTVLESTSGPCEHVKIHCIRQHWFHLPVSFLDDTRGGRAGHAVEPRWVQAQMSAGMREMDQ
jgi:hypothetical protein